MNRASSRRAVALAVATLILALGVAGYLLGSLSLTRATPTGMPTGSLPASAGATPTPSPTTGPTVTPAPTPEPTATPEPTPSLVAAPLTGRLVPQSVADRHVIAVMIDDLGAARPQSGLSSASVVWQAPAEGGIPRYMAFFQDVVPGDVGPIRSARIYFIAWASEWDSVYVHFGGSPQAKAALLRYGNGQWVYNADGFRWNGTYMWRVRTRLAPHNVYTDGKHLRRLAARVGAEDGPQNGVWQFAPETPFELRPERGRIVVQYRYNTIRYSYDRATNSYLRSVSVEGAQRDAGTHERIAPKNVVIMVMRFNPLNDKKHRLEADYTGSGKAWIATNGHTIKGTWKKKTTTGPTRFYDQEGRPVSLSIGQTFVQVVPVGTPVSIKDGKISWSRPLHALEFNL